MASEILLLQEDLVFPIDVEKIKLKDKSIVFSSYQNYAEKTGINVMIADDAVSCVALGTGKALDNLDKLDGKSAF